MWSSSMPFDTADPARVLLVGMGPTTETALESLLERFEVIGLVRPVSPDNPEDPALALAESSGVPVHSDTSVAGLTALVDAAGPDCVVVSSYDRILPPSLLAICPFVNVHYAPLPRYRGRATVNWAILNDEPVTAITVHTLAPGLDAGGILHQETVAIGSDDTVTDVYERLNGLQRKVLARAVARRLGGDLGERQDERQATYACTRVADDGEIEWGAPTAAVYRLVRALTPPFPGAFTWLGLRRVEVWRAEPVADALVYEGRVPGRVVRVSRGEGPDDGWVDVLTGDGVLRLHEVRVEGSTPVPANQLIRSVKATLGLRTADLVRALCELKERWP
jgi:methionyl-tRNA formyltransferase